MERLARILVLCLGTLVLGACVGGGGAAEPDAPAEETADEAPPEEPAFSRVEGVATALDYAGFSDEGLGRWQQELPRLEDVRISSTADGTDRAALWLPPAGDEPAPLLVVLHSWSTAYLQHQGIPLGLWAEENGWAMIAPDFRGVFDRPQAAGSNLAVSDVLDAVDWAVERAQIDEDRVFTIGFSGGGMMSLLMAGRHPARFAGAVSFVPVYDLVDFYVYNRDVRPDTPAYVRQIETFCGGDPTAGKDAAAECARRSPHAYLDAARAAGIPVFVAQGLADQIVRPDAALRAFNLLADERDRLPDGVLRTAFENELPEALHGSVEAETYFDEPDPDVAFARRSGPVTVVLFEGEHELVYHPGLRWMTEIAGDAR